MKKTLISALFLVGFGSYVVYAHSASSANAAPVTQVTTNTPASIEVVPTSSASSNSAPPTPIAKTPTPTPVTKPRSGQYVDGRYKGSVADAYYGYIQVEAIVSGGKLTDVIFLQYPNDRSTSIYINQQAMPMLRAEAIQAQSARVDGVSGASDSSQAFVESLSSALAQARA